jgi:hypothetical protein
MQSRLTAKLDQPEPESYLSEEANSGPPELQYYGA